VCAPAPATPYRAEAPRGQCKVKPVKSIAASTSAKAVPPRLCQGGNVSRACRAAGVGRSTHYFWLRDPAYAAAFREARTIAGEYLEAVAQDLATGAILKPIVSAGRVVTYQPIYNTTLLCTLLRANMPEKFGRQGGVPRQGASVVKLVDQDAWNSI
jgi:hypothetical protein